VLVVVIIILSIFLHRRRCASCHAAPSGKTDISAAGFVVGIGIVCPRGSY